MLPFQIGFFHLLISISAWSFLFVTVIRGTDEWQREGARR